VALSQLGAEYRKAKFHVQIPLSIKVENGKQVPNFARLRGASAEGLALAGAREQHHCGGPQS
jgi:hypothetical protein